MTHFRPMLAAHDLTEQQRRVIRILGEPGAVDASKVAEHTFILAPSLTRMIKTLEERKLIEKDKDEAEGRLVLLRIAPARLAIIDEVTAKVGRFTRRWNSNSGWSRSICSANSLTA